MADGELCLIDKNISSLREIPLNASVTSLNLHCNRVRKVEGLTNAWHLRHLDLSSNHISRIEGLGSLQSLRTLNLSCNLITKVEGLNGLVNLIRLNLSYNQISDLTGLLYLHGEEYKLRHLHLHSNRLDNINQLLQCMVGLQSLRDVTLSLDGKGNPVCSLPGYREMVLQSLPQVSRLDRVDRLGNAAASGEDSPMDIPGLEDYLDLLLSSDVSASELARGNGLPVATPRIDEVLSQFRHKSGGPADAPDPAGSTQAPQSSQPGQAPVDNEHRIQKLEHQVSRLFRQTPAGEVSSSPATSLGPEVRRPKRDTDNTSESECDGVKENRRRSRIPTQSKSGRSTAVKRTINPKQPVKTRQGDRARERFPSVCSDGERRTGRACSGVPGRKTSDPVGPGGKTVSSTRQPVEEEQTYRAIVEERDQERERRWKAEQAVRKLTEQMKSLQTQASQEKDLQSLALHTTDRLKELLLKERSERSSLQARVEVLEQRCQSATLQLEQALQREEQHRRALHSLEESRTRSEEVRAQQQAEEVKRSQELENKASALKRELDIQRSSLRQHKDKLRQLHELLASREQVHRKELEGRLVPGGAEFREAVAREVAGVEQRHARSRAELEERLSQAAKQYSSLEEEFRMALTIEAARFTEVEQSCQRLSAELPEVKTALSQTQHRERKAASLVQELTAMVKEQKSHISDLSKAKRDAVAELKERLRSLEAGEEENRRLQLQLELLKKDKARLLSQLTAQESVVDGLRAERRIWGQELAQQGASLSQDRGRLEARIEVLAAELESQKKQNERDNDSLKIKVKIIDDQTETIRKLKEGLQERDEQGRRQREENLQAQRRLQCQLEEESATAQDLRDTVEQLTLRKEQLKQQLDNKETELDQVREAHSASNKKWQSKAELLTRLESQVKSMKEGFDSRESLLLEERDKAMQAHKAAVEQLHNVDDAFRRQLESLQASHQADLLRLANDKQKQIDQATQKVFQVEEEMRQLLEETETEKRTMEEKMRRLTSVLKDF
ncbi:leucine-rich repeat and coiled-coil domain-containing protein 1 [Esox lucius]|uniref:Leucine-rich repeat and coiled-coil domain-containing protein 1 n=1 Tax=Esox lucius TaxID=8010 RepID=A0A3P9AKB3_ESOLU|nr:leucine-rich repeat and coiled-coil domain-containing protein 1 [Esox lucius]XP_019901148.2 leucine-rich repeat and coiled-coil domain-containing protein 1 [Esox lucius]XP_034147416.1 leucine-rich repeat and coiled-coil domain-containing protein 1 [Esox lucius]